MCSPSCIQTGCLRTVNPDGIGRGSTRMGCKGGGAVGELCAAAPAGREASAHASASAGLLKGVAGDSGRELLMLGLGRRALAVVSSRAVKDPAPDALIRV